MLESPVAIVTASGRGIGAACARRLAAAGHWVALMSRSPDAESLAKELGGVGLRGSVTDEDDLKRLVEAAMEERGRIDAVVNNAGNPARGDLIGLRDAQWTADFELVLLNVIRMARFVTPIMLRQGGGAFVNISAADAYEPDARFPIGSTLRAALGVWSKLYADRYAADGIRMNCVLPGYVLPAGSTDYKDFIEAHVPIRRAARYEEIADAVAYLLSPQASYITGQNIRVDGGLTRSV
jgi:NAD(P)-dependent dehydrogenase (short-subunit alcohol dehydrogenase family)